MSEPLTDFHDSEGLVTRYLQNPRPDLKDMIMVQFASLVERIARRFAGLEPHEDLVQVGFIGLLNALSKFDPEAGVRFNTYATHLVAGEIKHYLRDRSQTIRHPAWLQELRFRVHKAAGLLQGQLARVPTELEISEELGVSEAAVREVYQTQEMLKLGSLDATPQGDDDGAEVDNIDAADYSPEQISVEDRVVLEEAIKQLRDLERQVLVHFHFDSMNQTEIAHKLGISCNYVSHILRQSLAKLRRILANEDELDRNLKRHASALENDVIDPTTGAYNEDYFRNRLTEEVHRASSHEGALSLVLLDFTGMQSLLSFYGEASVRDFLADVADFLKSAVRRLDVVCRFGPTGFGIVLPATGSTVNVIQQRLTAKVDTWLTGRHAPNGPIQTRVGFAMFPDDARTAEELIAVALPEALEESLGQAMSEPIPRPRKKAA